MSPRQPTSKGPARGFTRIELLVCLVTLGLLAAVSRPVWGNGGPSRSLLCMDNLRRLQAAWLLYTAETGGVLPGNYHGGFVPGTDAPERPWATGWLDWTTSPDNTNTLYLTEARYASLAVYFDRDVTVYKCPADRYVSRSQSAQGWTERVRSYAMNCFLGTGNQITGPLNPAYRLYTKLDQFRRLTPGQVIVFLDEHPDSINDPLFWAPNNPQNWVDVPGSLHEGAAWLTFADGHLESHRWTNPKLLSPPSASDFIHNIAVPTNDPDLVWFLEHASEPKN
jgi:hypothetical protein